MPNTLDPVSRLAQFPTSVVSDALDELGIEGVLPGVRAQRIGQGRIAGLALPVRLEPKCNDPSAYRFGGGVGKPLEQVLKTMADGDVVVMDLGGSERAAAWGGLASRIAQRRACAERSCGARAATSTRSARSATLCGRLPCVRAAAATISRSAGSIGP
jgi:regulator of RNase E activity RraA